MSGKYDPPDKAQLLCEHPRITSTAELMVTAAEARFPAKAETEADASRARPVDETNSCQNLKGRKRVVTPERVELVCRMLAEGKTETAGCLRAGIGKTAWNVAKRSDSALRERIASARDAWARLRHQRHAAALYESQTARAAGRKALRPHPTRQANLVVWYLATHAPLNLATIPDHEIAAACERFNIHIDTWRRQEKAFGLMGKVYSKRTKIRGDQQPAATFAAVFQQDRIPENEDSYNELEAMGALC
jgi:hypothetical protein